MRIVSSKNDYDAPYDRVFMFIRKCDANGKYRVIASQNMTQSQDSHVMGEYETYVEAEKALSCCRQFLRNGYDYYKFPTNYARSFESGADYYDSKVYRNRKQW